MIPLNIDRDDWCGLILFLSGKIPLDVLEMLRHHTSIALKNSDILNKLTRQNQAPAGELVRSQDTRQIIEQTVQEVKHLFNADCCGICLLDEMTGELKLAGQQDFPELILKDTGNIEAQHPFSHFLSSKETIFGGDMKKFPDRYQNTEFLKKCTNSVWFITSIIIIDGRRAGTLTAVRYGDRAFIHEEKILLIAISQRLAIAFQNIDLHQKLLSRVNDLEKARKRLSESEQKMRITLDSVFEAIIVASLDGKILQANQGAAKMHGYQQAQDFIGKNSLRYVAFAERRRMLEYVKKTMETGVSRKTECTIITKNGTPFDAECSIGLQRNFLGIAEGFVICVRDISAGKNTEKRLIENERRYRLIAENTHDLIALMTFGGFYYYVSPSYRQLGYEPTELINKPGLDLIHPDDRNNILPLLLKYSQMDASDLTRFQKNNSTQRLEYRVKDKTGNWHSLDTTSNVIESQDGRGHLLLLVSRDVTARKKAADELRSLYAKVQSTSQALSREIQKRVDFFNALVHELKTPLTPILVSSETLKELAPDSTFQNLASNVFHSATRLNNRVDELLDLSRGELGLLKLQMDQVDFSLLLKEVINYIQPRVAQNQQFLITNIPHNLPQVTGDEMRIRQIILNLLDNAMKFTPENGNIFVEVISDSETLLTKIRDTGRGIDAIEKERIFKPYNRIEADRQHFSGLGLGLALCKQLVTLHGGNLWIESINNHGTTFLFTLPAIAPSQSSTSSAAPVNSINH